MILRRLLLVWRAAALTCTLFALSLPIAARLVTGPPGAVVHVRWQASVDASVRQRLEARFRLADGERLDGSTWRYDLLDPSQDMIRALVRDPAVDDTHDIDRSRFVLGGAQRTTRRGRFAHGGTLVTAADGVGIALGAFAALLTLVQISHTAPARNLWRLVRALVFLAESRLRPYVLLTILGVAVYAVALWLPPTDWDDVSYLSSVATMKNPLNYFIQDHGHGNQLYRPLTPVSMWLVYRAFGVWALPNQIINLALHMANVFLLYRIVRREQRDETIALLLAAVFMASKYTFLAATWTSDRPMVLTGLFLLLLINHLSQYDKPSGATSAAPLRVASVAAFSVLALMSKESGLVVPAVAFLFALVPKVVAHIRSPHRLSLAVVTASLIGLYVVFRLLIFGPDFGSYSQDGYMFLGTVHYEDSADLPPLMRYLNYSENVTKSALAPVVPVFDDRGALLSRQSFLSYCPVIVSTALLFGLAVRRHFSRLQWIALIAIFANAVVHFALFRFRLHYLSHAAFCLFVAGSPLSGYSHGQDWRKLAVQTLALIALVGGILWTSDALNAEIAGRSAALKTLRAESSERNRDVVERVLLRYR